MLNAHTATRTFREIKYDIRVFLETLRDVMDSSNDSVTVEALWSDGSMDIVPAASIVNIIVGTNFKEVSIEDVVLRAAMVASHDGNKVVDIVRLDIVTNDGLSARFASFGDATSDYEMKSCHIGSLVADDVTLGENVDVESLDIVGDITSGTAKVFALDTSTARVDSLSCSKTDMSRNVIDSSLHRVPGNGNTRTSDLIVTASINGSNVFQDELYVNGKVSLLSNSTSVDNQGYVSVYRDRLDGLTADLKIMAVGSLSVYWRDIVTGQKFNRGFGTEFSPESYFGMTMLYPRLSATSNGSRITFYMNPPLNTDKDTIVTVCNQSSDSIKACNVWKQTGSDKSLKAGMEALNYVVLPPYSRVDFLFTFTESVVDSTRYIYMMPLRNLSSSIQ